MKRREEGYNIRTLLRIIRIILFSIATLCTTLSSYYVP